MGTLDARDIFYGLLGLALLGLTLRPALERYRIMNVPLIYVGFGALIGWLGLDVIDPRANELSAKVVEHASELIVIISLAGAGLAIDTKATWRNWQPTFRLLIVAMPLTLLAVTWGGMALAGLPLAAALLLAAALAPTDPVLAQSVQVGPPGRDETPLEVALTAEAGLNDGLAFPFIYLAIAVATSGYALGDGWPDWGWGWVGFDLIYRVAAGWIVGYGCGRALSWLAFSRIGDARAGAWNSIVMVLAATMVSYGAAEAVDGYGFLAVFACARAGRSRSSGTEKGSYEKFVHHGADQLETILLALLLLWLGVFVGNGILAETTLPELALALALILVVRPLAGGIAMFGYDCPKMQAGKIAFFGVRGMGSVFYIAYAQTHGDFPGIDDVWRIAVLTICLSILVHGFAANFAIGEDEEDDPDAAEEPKLHPYAERLQGEEAARTPL